MRGKPPMNVQTYFDNGATSFPKPPQVAEAISRYLTEVGGNYGRSAHSRALDAGTTVETCRDKLADLLGISQPEHLCFANNATHAANVILQGFQFQEGAEVLVSPLEHNAIARPLNMLEELGRIRIKTLPAGPDGRIQPEKIQGVVTSNTALVVVNHQSNVNGVIQPLAEIRAALGYLPLLVDASQSAGKSPVKVDDWKIDYLIFTGHKSLLGPTGTGGMFIRHPDKILPLHLGGTGSNSEHLAMPLEMPDRYEAGTPNLAGIYGLLAALEHAPESSHSKKDFLQLMDAIDRIDGFHTVRAQNSEYQGEVISLHHDSVDSGTLSWELLNGFAIESRSGLHCAPLAHKYLNTFPHGSCRLTPSVYHTPEDFDYLLSALNTLSAKFAQRNSEFLQDKAS